MSVRSIHQLTSFAKRGDAIFDHAENLKELFVSWGKKSTIYVLNPDTKGYEGVEHIKRLRIGSDDILLYHFGIGSRLTAIFMKQRCIKFMVYHNMTPEKLLLGTDNQSYIAIRRGRKELDTLKNQLDGVIAVSQFNRQDIMEKHGYEDVAVVPLLKDFSGYDKKEPDESRLSKWKSDRKTIFFIGRGMPHKCHDDLIKILAAYKTLYGDDARLVMPGSFANSDSYMERLLGLSAKLGVSENVEFPGFIDDSDFHALFSTADVYLSMSEHEGFGVPLLEAMWFGVPVVAYGSCAIPEILGGAGIILKKKDPFVAATVLKEVFENNELRSKIVSSQLDRLSCFSKDAAGSAIGKVLSPYM